MRISDWSSDVCSSDLLATEPSVRAPADPLVLPGRPAGRLQFDALRFHYPARPQIAALDDLSLEVAAGETVAIVGPSGAGKTMLFQLLLRSYAPDYDIGRATCRESVGTYV